MIRRFLAISSLLAAASVMAAAQPPAVRPRNEPLVARPIHRLPTSRPERATLTPAELQAIERRLTGYRDHLLTAALRADALRRAGLSEEADAVELARATEPGEIGPVHVGLLTRRSTAPIVDVDPGLVEGLGSRLRVRLGRPASTGELAAEVAAFDDRIARMNEELAAKRPALARAMRREAGFPQDLERAILGIPPGDPQNDSEQVQKGFQALIQTLLLAETGAPIPRSPEEEEVRTPSP